MTNLVNCSLNTNTAQSSDGWSTAGKIAGGVAAGAALIFGGKYALAHGGKEWIMKKLASKNPLLNVKEYAKNKKVGQVTFDTDDEILKLLNKKDNELILEKIRNFLDNKKAVMGRTRLSPYDPKASKIMDLLKSDARRVPIGVYDIAVINSAKECNLDTKLACSIYKKYQKKPEEIVELKKALDIYFSRPEGGGTPISDNKTLRFNGTQINVEKNTNGRTTYRISSGKIPENKLSFTLENGKLSGEFNGKDTWIKEYQSFLNGEAPTESNFKAFVDFKDISYIIENNLNAQDIQRKAKSLNFRF